MPTNFIVVKEVLTIWLFRFLFMSEQEYLQTLTNSSPWPPSKGEKGHGAYLSISKFLNFRKIGDRLPPFEGG